MDYIVSGVPLSAFQPLFGLDATALRAQGVVRVTADAKPGSPCRITLEDAERVVAQHLRDDRADRLPPHRPGHRSDGPIFVREAAAATREARNAIPEQQRSRLLSVRAYDAGGWMRDAEVVKGVALEALTGRFFADADVAFLHVHNARRGCYACRIDRP